MSKFKTVVDDATAWISDRQASVDTPFIVAGASDGTEIVNLRVRGSVPGSSKNNDPAIRRIEGIAFVPNPTALFWQHSEDRGDGLAQYKLDNGNQDPAMGKRRRKRPDWQQVLEEIHQQKTT